MDKPIQNSDDFSDRRTTGRQSISDTPLKKYFEAAVKHGASDVLMRGGQSPRLRLGQGLKPLDTPPIDLELFEKWVGGSLSESQRDKLRSQGSLDLGVDFELEPGQVHRFRVNIFPNPWPHRHRSQTCEQHNF